MTTNFEQVYYENPALWVPERFGSLVTERINLALEWMPSEVNSVLDIGCGNGVFVNHLYSKASFLSVVGTDRSFAALQKVRSNRGQVDIASLPFRDHGFDFVVSMEVIEHLPYHLYKQSLTEIVRVAKNYILITVPYKENRSFKQVACPECGCIFHPDYHSRSFTEQDMQDLFKDWACIMPIKIQGIVAVKEFMFPGLWKMVRRAYLRGRDFPMRALCPQCGYSENSSAANVAVATHTSGHVDKRINWKVTTRSLWPKKTTRCWWMALYRKEH